MKFKIIFMVLAALIGAEAVVAKPKLENLLRSQLQGAKGTEVIVSRVTLEPNATLPKHWHPGEEFAYLLKGDVVLWQKGKKDSRFKAGEVAQIPLKQVHTATAGSQGATILVFRVHESGQPERTLVQ